MTTEYKFVLNIMVNHVACYHIVHSASILTLDFFSAKSLLCQNWVVLYSGIYLLHNIYWILLFAMG